jgi:type II secretory pathway component GspD/PulD (secretin)/tetratricopeptide (TPR) repeat protein
MINASKSFCLILLALAVSGSGLKAQPASDTPVVTAEREAIVRQADTIALRQTLIIAQSARARGDLLAANKAYEKCYDLVQRIGSGVEPEATQTISGLSSVLLDLARECQRHQDYKAAEERVNRVLVVDPQNRVALEFKRQNRQLLEAQAGTIPSQELIERLPSFRTNEIEIATMVQDGKLLFEAGKIDEAEDKLNQAYLQDPSNVAAYQYLQLIRQHRMADAARAGELENANGLIKVEKEWTKDARTGELLPHPNMFARTNLVHTGSGRQVIMSKLDRIHIDAIKYDNLPLPEVINNLADLARARDPDKTGINFLVDHQAPASAPSAVGAIDPATGLPVAPLPTEQADIGSVNVRITPGLNDVRLADVLDAIVLASDKPIKYSVLDYAIVFSLRGPELASLETRTFRVDPNTFRQGLQSVEGIPFANVTTSSGSGGGGGSSGGGGQGGSGSTTTVLPQVNVTGAQISTTGGGGGGGGQTGGGGGGSTGAGLAYVTGSSNLLSGEQTLVRSFFASIGIDTASNNPANIGKMFVFNDRKGILTVRATSAELDMIDAAIQALNQAPPEINIKAKFIEITEDDNRALGFNWFLGNTQIGGTLASGGTQPSFSGSPSTGNPEGTFPGSLLGATTTAPATTDGNVTSGLRNIFGPLGNTTPTVGSITGILTDPQFKVAILALEQRDGVDELNAPEVTTESGRQAQIQAVDVQTIVTGQTIGATPGAGAGVSGVANGLNSPIVQTPIANNYQTQPLPFGPVLDVIPYVSSDEYSVQMTLIPTITEFIGYDDPGQFVPSALVSGQTGNASLTAVLPLPHFRLREVITSVTVWDSQTVVLGGLMTDVVTKIKDKVPMLGDLPLVGRLFQSQSSSKSKKNLMIFVTPTIINPDGTRYHSDDEMPFLQSVGAAPKITAH